MKLLDFARRPRRIARRLALGLVAAMFLATCATVPVYRITKVDFPNKATTLENGLRVVAQPDYNFPYVAVVVRYGVGSAYDPPDKKGLAHLVEHLAFRLGDELLPAQAENTAAAAADAGAKADATPVLAAIDGSTSPAPTADTATTAQPAEGQPAAAATPATTTDEKPTGTKQRVVGRFLIDENAFTGSDETVYWAKAVPADLKGKLEALAKQMGDFSGLISPEVFSTERDVILAERRTRYEGQPLDRVMLDWCDRFFPEGHPYKGQCTIGSEDTIKSIQLADVKKYLEAHYHPGNATIAIVGPIDPQEALALVEKTFGAKAKREPSKIALPQWQPKTGVERIELQNATQAMVTVSWPIGERFSPSVEAAKILIDRGWFGYRLAANRDLAFWARSFLSDNDHGSAFIVQALLKDPADADTAAAEILKVADLINVAIDEEDFLVTRRRHTYEAIYDAESANSRAIELARYFAYTGKPVAWMDEYERARALDLGQVRRAGSELLEADRALVLVHMPAAQPTKTEQEEATPAAPYQEKAAAEATKGDLVHEKRVRPPAVYRFDIPGTEFAKWVAADAERWQRVPETKLANGLRYRVIHRPGLPITSISATMLGGNLLEPADKIGVSALMAGLSGLSGSADRANQWRMGIEGDVGADSETVTMRQKMLSYYADEAFRLFAKEVQSPKYRRFTLVDAREAVANSYGEWDKRVQALSARAMWRHFGLQGVEPLPTKETVESIGLTDLWAQHARLAYPENTCLTIATDLDREQIDKLVNDYFGGWSSAGVPAVDLDALARPLAPTAEGTAIVIEAPTAKESSIVLALPAPGWKDWQEHLKAEMVAALIGEEVEHLREAMGITYGASASVASIRNQSLITLKSSVEAAKTDDAVDAVLRIVDKLRHTPISSDKVDFAKRNALAQFVGSGHTSDSAVKGHAQEMVRDLPRDHRRQAIEFISKVTRDDLQKTLDDLLGQAPTLVVAGKAPTLPDNRTGLLGAFTKVERYTPEQLTK